MSAKCVNSSETIQDLMRSYQSACVLAAGAELDVFSVLGEKGGMAEQVAGGTGSEVRGMRILLDALAALGLLEKQNEIYRVPGDVAELLTESSRGNILPAIRHQANCLRRWAELARVVQTGQPGERVPSVRGQQADLESFIGAMHNFSEPMADAVVRQAGSGQFRCVLDIGGASGTWTKAFLRAFPEMRATIFDLPEVIPMAKKRMAAEGLAERIRLVGGDYNVDELPEGADLAWLSAIAHQNSLAQNRELYRKIHKALNDNGVLVIRDVVLDESRTKPRGGALFAVNMLVGTEGGNSYTLKEYQEDLTEAGFAEVTLIQQDEFMNSLVRAVKK